MGDIIDISDFREPEVDQNQPALVRTVGMPFGKSLRYYQVPGGLDLPWTPISDIGTLLGLSGEDLSRFVASVGIQWLGSLKVVNVDAEKVVIVPFLGAAALIVQFADVQEELGEDDFSPLEIYCDGAADASGLSSGASTKGQFFQNLVVAARSAASPIDLYGAIKPLGAKASA